MGYLRCPCGKIVAEAGRKLVVIKCRRCKRYVVINTLGLVGVNTLPDGPNTELEGEFEEEAVKNVT